MSAEEHKAKHEELHKHLDELTGDFLFQTNKLPTEASIMDLLEWSHAQTLTPTGEWHRGRGKGEKVAKTVTFTNKEVEEVRNAISIVQETLQKDAIENEETGTDLATTEQQVACLEEADKKLAKEEDKLAEFMAAFKDCGGCGRALLHGYKKILLDALSELERKKTTSSPDISGKLHKLHWNEVTIYRAALKDVRFLIGGKKEG